jgi:hypothetical protein
MDPARVCAPLDIFVLLVASLRGKIDAVQQIWCAQKGPPYQLLYLLVTIATRICGKIFVRTRQSVLLDFFARATEGDIYAPAVPLPKLWAPPAVSAKASVIMVTIALKGPRRPGSLSVDRQTVTVSPEAPARQV